jgi:predicted component of type VI protein secretion system
MNRAIVRVLGPLPVRLVTAILFDGETSEMQIEGSMVRVNGIVATFRDDDAPTWRLEAVEPPE